MKGLGLGSVRLGEGRLGRSGVPPPGGRGERRGQPAAAGSLGSRGAPAPGSEGPLGTPAATPEGLLMPVVHPKECMRQTNAGTILQHTCKTHTTVNYIFHLIYFLYTNRTLKYGMATQHKTISQSMMMSSCEKLSKQISYGF